MNFPPKARKLLVIIAIPVVIASMFFYLHRRPTLDTFSTVPEIAGCPCYYAKDNNALVKKQYVFAKDSTGAAYISLGGEITKFNLKSIQLLDGNKRTVTAYSHEEYELKVDLTRSGPKEPFKGTLKVKHNESEEATVYLYGACECE